MNKRIKIAVTGSRGKSSVVRLLHVALTRCGLRTYTRVTGVVPRVLTPEGEKPILRFASASVDEMKWWLRILPDDAEAVVMENSAVAPELQGFCAHCLNPDVTVLTNIRPDHEAYWGPNENDVLNSLSQALPQGGRIVVPERLTDYPPMRLVARERSLTLIGAHRVSGFVAHMTDNVALALETCRIFGLNEKECLEAMMNIPPDLADFTVLDTLHGKLAFAFSANDVVTTEELFKSTGWKREETGVLFNHRSDRVDRFHTFEKWLSGHPWREIVVIGDAPPASSLDCEYFPCHVNEELRNRLNGLQWIGCGNTVYGLPLLFKLECEEKGVVGH